MTVLAARVIGGGLSFLGLAGGAANAAPWYQGDAPLIVSLTGVGALGYSIYKDQREDRQQRRRRRR